MKNKKSLIVTMSMLLTTALLVACAGPGGGSAPAAGGGGAAPAAEAAADEVFTAILASANTPTHPIVMAMVEFGDIMYEKSGGRIVLDVFHSAQLGSERDIVEGMMLNTIQFAAITSAPLSGFTDAYTIFDLPFLFESLEEGRMVTDSPLGDELLLAMTDIGLLGLSWFEHGMRNITNSVRPINTPEDLQGIRIRTMENPMHMEAFRVMGADPVPMAFGELFTALQQGALDAQENPVVNIHSSAFYEVQTYLTMSGHVYAPAPMLVSLPWFNSLPADLQEVVREAAVEAQAWMRDMNDQMHIIYLEELVDFGMIVGEVDVAPFAEATRSVHDMFVGDLVDPEIYAVALALLEEFRN